MPVISRRVFMGAAVSVCAGAPSHAMPSALVTPVLRLPADDHPTVALTLDACPGAFDLRLARALVDLAIPTTLFLTNIWIHRNPEAVSFLQNHHDLFSLQNHGDRHLPPVLGAVPVYGLPVAGTIAAIEAEVVGGAHAVAAVSGVAPHWYRGAAALYSPDALTPIGRLGFGIGGFSLNADMGASLPARSVAARIGQARDRDVIIGHINQPLRPSGAGIAAGVAALKAQGMRFVRLPDQIAI